MNSQQVQDIRLMYEAVYNNELREKAEEYNNVANEEYVDEDVQKVVGRALDTAAKNPVIKSIGKVISPVGKGRKTPTATSGGYRPVKEDLDIFDVILEHLVVEGYADTNQAALAIMANMSEEWKQSIVEQRVDVGGGRTVGPVAGAVHSLLTGNLPKSRTYIPPSAKTPTNRAPSIPASKDDSGKLTDFGKGGGRKKMKQTGMTVGQVERLGRRNVGDYSN